MDPKVVFGIVRNLAYYEMKYFERPQIRYVNNDMKYLFVKIYAYENDVLTVILLHSTFGLPYLLTEGNLIESSPLLAPNGPVPEKLYEPAPKILDFSLAPIASPDFIQIKQNGNI